MSDLRDYSHHLTQMESLMKQIRELAPAKSLDVVYLCERLISHTWEVRDCAELGYPLPESGGNDPNSGILPRATFPPYV